VALWSEGGQERLCGVGSSGSHQKPRWLNTIQKIYSDSPMAGSVVINLFISNIYIISIKIIK